MYAVLISIDIRVQYAGVVYIFMFYIQLIMVCVKIIFKKIQGRVGIFFSLTLL